MYTMTITYVVNSLALKSTQSHLRGKLDSWPCPSNFCSAFSTGGTPEKWKKILVRVHFHIASDATELRHLKHCPSFTFVHSSELEQLPMCAPGLSLMHNSHRPPNTTRQCCLCRVWRGGVNSHLQNHNDSLRKLSFLPRDAMHPRY